MSWIERMLEESLSRAAANGELDAPTLQGKPIADLDHQRRQGWWADRFVARELSHDRRVRATENASTSRAGFWRATSLAEVRELVEAANAAIERANLNMIESDRIALFDSADIERRWLALR